MNSFHMTPEHGNFPEHPAMRICECCHQPIVNIQMLTPGGETVCPHCGFCKGGTQATVWVCEECGELINDYGGDLRPVCPGCGEDLVAYVAHPSQIQGVGTGDKDLEMGLDILMDAQVKEIHE